MVMISHALISSNTHLRHTLILILFENTGSLQQQLLEQVHVSKWFCKHHTQFIVFQLVRQTEIK